MRALAVLLLLAPLLLAACEPVDRHPGLWLSGDVVSEPVTDWSFTDDVPLIYVETNTWYGIPHSVTTVCARDGEKLYVPSLYREGGKFPDKRFWNRNVVRDPHVRLKIGERVYERSAVLVEDPEEWQAALAAFARKSDFWKQLAVQISENPAAEAPRVYFLRMDPRSDAS